MLDLMRKHAQSWLIKAALGGIIVTFVLWYGWPSGSDQRKDYVAKVNGTAITYDQFRSLYEAELEKIRMRFKGSIPPELMEKLNLKKGILQAMVHRTLLLQEGQKLGLNVTDQDIINDIKHNPMFQRDGAFDENIYRSYIGSLRLTPAAFEATRKQELLEQQVVNLLTDSVKTNPEEIKNYWHFQNDKLTLSVLMIPLAEAKENSSVEEKALELFFRENQSKYEIPQTLDISYVAFSWRDMVDKEQVSDDEVKAYYQGNPKEFITAEKAKVRHIFKAFPEDADDEKKNEIKAGLENIRQRAQAGEDFGELAKTESQDPTTAEKGGDLGTIQKGSINPSIERAAFKLEPGQISDPIFLEGGYSIIKVDEKTPETQISFEEAAPGIKQKLSEDRAKKKVTAASDEFYERVYRSDDLEGSAKQFGFNLNKAMVTKIGGVPGLGSDPKITDEIFSLKTGDVSRLIRSGDNFVIVKLNERKKERIPNLEEIRSAVEVDFRKDQSIKQSMNFASKIIEDLKKNPGEYENVAQKNGLKWEQLQPINRITTFIPKLGSGQSVTDMLTSISETNSIFGSPIATSEGAAIVKLDKIDKGSDEQFAKDAAVMEKWVLDVRKEEFLKGWLKVMEEKSKIDLNDKNL